MRHACAKRGKCSRACACTRPAMSKRAYTQEGVSGPDLDHEQARKDAADEGGEDIERLQAVCVLPRCEHARRADKRHCCACTQNADASRTSPLAPVVADAVAGAGSAALSTASKAALLSGAEVLWTNRRSTRQNHGCTSQCHDAEAGCCSALSLAQGAAWCAPASQRSASECSKAAPAFSPCAPSDACDLASKSIE